MSDNGCLIKFYRSGGRFSTAVRSQQRPGEAAVRQALGSLYKPSRESLTMAYLTYRYFDHQRHMEREKTLEYRLYFSKDGSVRIKLTEEIE